MNKPTAKTIETAVALTGDPSATTVEKSEGNVDLTSDNKPENQAVFNSSESSIPGRLENNSIAEVEPEYFAVRSEQMADRKRRERELAEENSGQKTTLADFECSDLNSEPVLVNKTKTVRFDIPDSQEQNDKPVTVEMNTVSLIEDNICFVNDNFEFMDGVGTQSNTQWNDMRKMQEIISENEYYTGSAQGEFSNTALNQTQTYGFKTNSRQSEYSADVTKESSDVTCGNEILEDSMLLTNSKVQHEINLADAVMTPEVQELNFEIAEIGEPGMTNNNSC
ncbi:hypothetical protein ACROYT_G031721 [Oculina patagonica]